MNKKSNNIRYSFIRFLRNRISKTPPYSISPKWIRIIECILFPLRSFYLKNSHIRYDLETDTYTIRGIKYDGYTFRFFNDCADCKKNKVFKFIKSDNGYITLEEIKLQ